MNKDKLLYDFLLKNGAHSYSFKIVHSLEEWDDSDAITLISEKYIKIFIDKINNSEFVWELYNDISEYNDIFNITKDYIRAKPNKSLLSKRIKKLGKIKYEIFRKEIINTL